MKLYRALSALLPSSSSQAGKCILLRTGTALQACSLSSRAATAKPASRKSAGATLGSPEEKWRHGGSPPQAPAKVAEEEEAATPPPKPSEIPWQVKVANSVHLIGRLGAPVELGTSPNGAYTAASILFHEKTHDLPHFRIPLVFQGDMAQIAACNLREEDRVYVTGQLTGGSPLVDNNAETKMQVMVQNISYVCQLPLEKNSDRNSNGLSSSSVKDAPSVVQLWHDLFSKPHKWWDYRSKGNKKSGSFKHKDTGQILEINESTPEWVLSMLDTFVFSSETSGIKPQSARANKSGESVAGYWNDLFANPQLWRDNRGDKQNGKKSPKAPDFSHKDTRQGLWLDSAPDWVLPKLESIVFGAEARWRNAAKKISTGVTEKEESWGNLIENPDKWWDKRSDKKNPRAPDFKHKETGEALWLDSTTTPKWVFGKLPPTNAKQ